MKRCILEDRPCNNCGECDRCDLDPNKICDNCEKCLKQTNAQYYEIQIDEIIGGKQK